jgi:hypothetical protein
VVFEGGLEVDWSFSTASAATRPIGHTLLFERRPIPVSRPERLTEPERRALAKRWCTFFWAMAPIAVRLCARGDTRRSSAQTDLLTRALISLWRLTEQPDVTDPWLPHQNAPLEDDIDRRIPKPGTELTLAVVFEHVALLCDEAKKLQAKLLALDAAANDAIIADTNSLIELARRVIDSGEFRDRKYR